MLNCRHFWLMPEAIVTVGIGREGPLGEDVNHRTVCRAPRWRGASIQGCSMAAYREFRVLALARETMREGDGVFRSNN